MFVEEELELDVVVGGVVLLLVVGVVGVWDGSGASDRADVLVDVELGTGGLLEEADVGPAAAEDELEGAGVLGADWASVGRCMSRLAALVPSRWATSAFAAAAAAEVFVS
jgi:hypothetical protein